MSKTGKGMTGDIRLTARRCAHLDGSRAKNSVWACGKPLIGMQRTSGGGSRLKRSRRCRQRGGKNEGHNSGWRIWDKVAPAYVSSQQTSSSGLQQADDLLPY